MTHFDQTEMLYHQINNVSKNTNTNGKINSHMKLCGIASSKKNETNAINIKEMASNSGRQANFKSQYFTQFKFQMIFVILFCCLFTCSIKYANTQETNYFYADGNWFCLKVVAFSF